MRRVLNLPVVLTSLLVLSCGGGGSSQTACGANTTLVDGVCVSTVDEVSCGDGTVFNPETQQCESEVKCGVGSSYNPSTGECEPDSACGPGTTFNEASGLCEPDIVCGDDTTYNPQTGECEPNVVCGPDAVEVDGKCVATDEKCGPGTTFDPTTGTCSPDLVCGPGLTPLNDRCLSAADIAASEADATESIPDNNDPDLGGTPETLVLEPIGEATIFTGVIARPNDLDGDEVADQDVDVWSFEGREGQLLRIRLLPNGLPQPTFVLRGPQGYERSSILGTEVEADRQVVLPYDGTYSLWVLPAIRRLGSAPTGGTNHGYVGIIEELAWPEPTELVLPAPGAAAATSSGEVRGLEDNFFKVISDPNSAMVLSMSSEGVNVLPLLLTFSSTGAFLGELRPKPATGLPAGSLCDGGAFLQCDGGPSRCVGAGQIYVSLGTCVPSTSSQTDPLEDRFVSLNALYAAEKDGLIVVVDWIFSQGGEQPFEVGVRNANLGAGGTLAPDSMLVTESEAIAPGEAVQFPFEVSEGEVITSVFAGAGTRTLVGPTGIVAMNASATFDFYATQSDTYVWLILNEGDSTQNFSVAIFSQTPETFDVSTFDGTPLTASFSGPDITFNVYTGEGVWFVADPQEAMLVRSEWRFMTGQPNMEVFRVADSGLLTDRRDANVDALYLRSALAEDPGPVLFRFGNDLGGRVPDETVQAWTVDLQALPVPPFAEVEPNDDAAFATDLGTLGSEPIQVLGANENNIDEHDYYTFELDPPLAAGEIVEISIENVDGTSAPRLRIRDGDLNQIYPVPGDTGVITSATAIRWPLAPHDLDGISNVVLHIEATSTSGPARYVLDIRRVTKPFEVEPNDTVATAHDLGDLVLPFSFEGLAGATGTNGDVDLFSFTVSSVLPPAGLRIRINAQQTDSDLKPALYNTDGTTKLLENDEEENVWIFQPQSAGPYFLELKSDSTSNITRTRLYYRVSIDTVDNSEVEPNNSIAEATDLGVLSPGEATTVWGHDDRTASDYFQIALDSPLASDEVLSVKWTHFTQRGNTQVHFYNSDGTALISNQMYAHELAVAPVGDAGPFWIQVVPNFSSGNGSQAYTLEVARLTGVVGEQEPNDDQATAQPIDLPVTIRAQSNPSTAQLAEDRDVYQVTLANTLAGGEVLRIETDHLVDKALGLDVVVLDETFTEIAGISGLNPAMDVVLPDGTAGAVYYIEFLAENGGPTERMVYQADISIVTP